LNVGKSPRVLEQVLQNAKHFAFFSAEVVQKLRFLNNSIIKKIIMHVLKLIVILN
jgi:hypothetical protein